MQIFEHFFVLWLMLLHKKRTSGEVLSFVHRTFILRTSDHERDHHGTTSRERPNHDLIKS